MLQACTAATIPTNKTMHIHRASPLPPRDGFLDSANRGQELVQRRECLHVVRREVASCLPHEGGEEQ